MCETANARGVPNSYLEMKRRQFQRAALHSLKAAAIADRAGDMAGSRRHWRRYEQARDLIENTNRDLRSGTVAGLSRIVARVLRTPLASGGVA